MCAVSAVAVAYTCDWITSLHLAPLSLRMVITFALAKQIVGKICANYCAGKAHLVCSVAFLAVDYVKGYVHTLFHHSGNVQGLQIRKTAIQIAHIVRRILACQQHPVGIK